MGVGDVFLSFWQRVAWGAGLVAVLLVSAAVTIRRKVEVEVIYRSNQAD
jgi:hypothetical protein